MENQKNNHQDPQPDHGNDSKGHQNNGQKKGHDNPSRPSRPAKPGNSHAVVSVWNNKLFNN